MTLISLCGQQEAISPSFFEDRDSLPVEGREYFAAEPATFEDDDAIGEVPAGIEKR